MNSDKPRILFVMHLPPPVHGAAMVGETIRRSRAVNDRFDCRYFNLATARSLEDIGRFSLSKIFDVVRRIRKVCAAADDFRPDLVYLTPSSTGMPFYKDYLMARALKKRGYKIVYHYHNKGVSSRQNRFPDNSLYTDFFRGAKVMLLSSLLYRDVEKYVDSADVLVCNNGIDIATFDRSTLPPAEVPHILFLSNLFRTKGVLTLLDALSLLRARGMRFRAIVAGAPTEEIGENDIRTIIGEKGLAGCTEYAGAVYGAEKDTLLSRCDIFAFPTVYSYEAFPLVLLEAMSHSMACVATAEGGIPDIIAHGETGFLMRENTPQALAEALAPLIADADMRRQMGVRGLARFQSRFTIGRFEENFIKALEKCV